MHYLIDGHNLIAKMPDIALDDPNDEALLVLKLRSWAAGGRKRLITVIFDRGLPSGRSRILSRGQVNVIFASEGRTADALLINRILKATNPAEYTLISSDRQVISAARARRMKHISASAFAKRLSEATEKKEEAPEPVSPAEAEDPVMSHGEVDEWLELFEAAPRFKPEVVEPRPQNRGSDEPETAEPTPRRPDPNNAPGPAILKDGARKLSNDEVDEWLKLFRQGDAE